MPQNARKQPSFLAAWAAGLYEEPDGAQLVPVPTGAIEMTLRGARLEAAMGAATPKASPALQLPRSLSPGGAGLLSGLCRHPSQEQLLAVAHRVSRAKPSSAL